MADSESSKAGFLLLLTPLPAHLSSASTHQSNLTYGSVFGGRSKNATIAPCFPIKLLQDFFPLVEIVDRGKFQIMAQEFFQRLGQEFPIFLDKTQFHPDPTAILAGLLQFGFGGAILRFGLALVMALALASIVDPSLASQATLVDEDIIDHFIRAILLQVKGILGRLTQTAWLVQGIFGAFLYEPCSRTFAGRDKGLNRTENEGRVHLVGHEIAGQELLWGSESG